MFLLGAFKKRHMKAVEEINKIDKEVEMLDSEIDNILANAGYTNIEIADEVLDSEESKDVKNTNDIN